MPLILMEIHTLKLEGVVLMLKVGLNMTTKEFYDNYLNLLSEYLNSDDDPNEEEDYNIDDDEDLEELFNEIDDKEDFFNEFNNIVFTENWDDEDPFDPDEEDDDFDDIDDDVDDDLSDD